MKSLFFTFALTSFLSVCVLAQLTTNAVDKTQEIREYTPANIRVEGEVESPVTVFLHQLPLQSVSVREAGIDSAGSPRFKGAYSCTGYALSDILGSVKIAKKNKNEFRPSIDVYFIVANEKGDRAVFGWGEVFYSRNNSRILVTRSVRQISPSKVKAKRTLPDAPRLICAGDLNNARFIDNPTMITVRSYGGAIQAGSKDSMYSPAIEFASGSATSTLNQMNSGVQSRKFTYVGFGHGMGYKGLTTIEGYPLKEIFKLDCTTEDLRNSIAVVSSKDGYRAVFSVSEIWNRNDMDDFLLIDQKDSKSDGRYSLFVPADFFVDRNVKAVAKIQMVSGY